MWGCFGELRERWSMVHGWAGLPEGDFKDMDPWAVVNGNQDTANPSVPTSNAGGYTSGGQVKER